MSYNCIGYLIAVWLQSFRKLWRQQTQKQLACNYSDYQVIPLCDVVLYGTVSIPPVKFQSVAIHCKD